MFCNLKRPVSHIGYSHQNKGAGQGRGCRMAGKVPAKEPQNGWESTSKIAGQGLQNGQPGVTEWPVRCRKIARKVLAKEPVRGCKMAAKWSVK